MKGVDIMRGIQTVLLVVIVAQLSVGDGDAGATIGGGEASQSELRGILRRLATSLEKSPGIAATTESLAEQRQPVTDDGVSPNLSPLVAQLKRLEVVLHRSAVSRGGASAVTALRRQITKPNMAAVRAEAARFERLKKKGRQREFIDEYLLVGADELLRRLGRPTEMSINDGQNWNYVFDEDKSLGLYFTLADGYIIEVQVSVE